MSVDTLFHNVIDPPPARLRAYSYPGALHDSELGGIPYSAFRAAFDAFSLTDVYKHWSAELIKYNSSDLAHLAPPRPAPQPIEKKHTKARPSLRKIAAKHHDLYKEMTHHLGRVGYCGTRRGMQLAGTLFTLTCFFFGPTLGFCALTPQPLFAISLSVLVGCMLLGGAVQTICLLKYRQRLGTERSLHNLKNFTKQLESFAEPQYAKAVYKAHQLIGLLEGRNCSAYGRYLCTEILLGSPLGPIYNMWQWLMTCWQKPAPQPAASPFGSKPVVKEPLAS